jgi:type VI secretion system protein ImpC
MNNDRSKDGFEIFNNQVTQLPFKMLVLSELAPRDIQTGKSSVSKKLRIDKDNFKSVMSEIASQVTLSLPNRLGNDPKEIIVDVPLKDVNSFKPEFIAENTTVLKDLLDVRDLLVYMKDHKLSQEEIQDRLDRSVVGAEIMSRVRNILFTPTSSEPTKKDPQAETKTSVLPLLGGTRDDTLNDLFSIVELPNESAPRSYSAETALDRIISMLTSVGKDYDSIDKRAIDSAVMEMDGVISSQVNEIMHHKEFRRLESSWRGLKFLVDRTDFRENIQIEVMSVSKNSLREVFHESIFQSEYDGEVDFPLSVVVADYEFDNSTPDVAILLDLSTDLEAIQVPLISSISSEFFGVSTADGINSLPYLGEVMSRSEYVKWNGFRETDSSRWVTMTFNRFLLRLPYGRENRVKRFDFSETGSYFVWGNPVWAVGSLMTSSFAKLGWATEIYGAKNGVVENLPVREYAPKNGEKTSIPLETFIPIQLGSDIADNGIVSLMCRVNFDSTILTSIPTAHTPAKYGDEKVTEDSILRATLPYQLLVSRIAQYMQIIQNQIIPGNSPNGIEEGFTDALIRFVSIKGSMAVDAVQVKVSQDRDRPNFYDIAIHIRPGREILAGRAYLELHLPARI